jgi:hypothetical protein
MFINRNSIQEIWMGNATLFKLLEVPQEIVESVTLDLCEGFGSSIYPSVSEATDKKKAFEYVFDLVPGKYRLAPGFRATAPLSNHREGEIGAIFLMYTWDRTLSINRNEHKEHRSYEVFDRAFLRIACKYNLATDAGNIVPLREKNLQSI